MAGLTIEHLQDDFIKGSTDAVTSDQGRDGEQEEQSNHSEVPSTLAELDTSACQHHECWRTKN